MDDIIELIIYIAIGVIGLLAGAYRNKQKRQSQQNRMPRDIMANPMPEVQPDLGPLAEIFGIPEIIAPAPVHVPEKKEQGVEEEGYRVEEKGFLVERTGIDAETQADTVEKEGLNAEKFSAEGMPVFKTTKTVMLSDSITDNAITDSEGIYDTISASEIKSLEDVEEFIDNEKINWRKAVIYSEILKRRGN